MHNCNKARYREPVRWTLILYCLLVGLSNALIEKDGIWSTRDFAVPNLDYQVINGMLVPDEGSEMEERLNSAKMREPRLADCYESSSNVQLIKTLFSEEQYNYIFSARDESMTY